MIQFKTSLPYIIDMLADAMREDNWNQVEYEKKGKFQYLSVHTGDAIEEIIQILKEDIDSTLRDIEDLKAEQKEYTVKNIFSADIKKKRGYLLKIKAILTIIDKKSMFKKGRKYD